MRCHRTDGFGDNALHRTAPTGMDGGYGPVCFIIKKHRYAVGRRDADADARHVGHHGVDAFKAFAAGHFIELKQRGTDCKHFLAMHLVRQDEPVRLYAQFAAQGGAVGGYVSRIVATIAVYVKRRVIPLTAPAETRCRERPDSGAEIVFKQFGLTRHRRQSLHSQGRRRLPRRPLRCQRPNQRNQQPSARPRGCGGRCCRPH